MPAFHAVTEVSHSLVVSVHMLFDCDSFARCDSSGAASLGGIIGSSLLRMVTPSESGISFLLLNCMSPVMYCH